MSLQFIPANLETDVSYSVYLGRALAWNMQSWEQEPSEVWLARVAISNHRLVAFEHDQVTFRYKDYAHGNKKHLMTLSSHEFLRRFLLHVLPRGFVRIRFYGFLANRRKANLLPLCQQLLLHHPKADPSPPPDSTATPITGFRCPHCATVMRILETFSASTFAPTAPRSTPLDSS